MEAVPLDNTQASPVREFLRWLQTKAIKMLLLNVLIMYVSVPFLIRIFPSLLQKFVYLNFLMIPLWADFQNPGIYLNHTVNFYLTSEPGVTFGVWHALPQSRWKESEGKDHSWHEEALSDANPIIIYLHGNGGSRATSHRVRFIKVMSEGGFHVLAVDYRGYADSTGEPSEDGFTKDILYIYNWVKERSGSSTVVLWGHSLGTGISTNTAMKLKEKDGTILDTIVLEAPFTNIRDAAANIPITKIYRKFPGFEYLILDTMARAGMYFPNDKNVQVLSNPLLILHSEDDAVIPVHLGRKLFETAYNASAKKENVKFISFPRELGLGHDHISSHPELPSILKGFLESIK